MDPRYESLADNLVAHSTKLKEGEKALIHAYDVPDDITLALIRAVRSRGAIPFVQLESSRIHRLGHLRAWQRETLRLQPNLVPQISSVIVIDLDLLTLPLPSALASASESVGAIGGEDVVCANGHER